MWFWIIFFWKQIKNNFWETLAQLAIKFSTKWCVFQPSRSKTVGEDRFLAVKSYIFRRTFQILNIKNTSIWTMCKIYNVNNNENWWYIMFLSLHWWNNIEKKIHHIKKTFKWNDVEFDFSMSTVLEIFSFF